MFEAADDAEVPEFPDEIEYVWDWFVELHEARTGNGFGPNPLSFTELAHWQALCDTRIQPWEVRAIRAIDNAYIASRRPSKPPVSGDE